MATPERFIIENMLRIVDKHGQEVPFILNKAQRELDENLSGRDIIPKSRQRGISTYMLARFTVKCMAEMNKRFVVISHDTKATQKMLEKVHFFISKLDPKPVIKTSNKNEIKFAKTNCAFYIGTAGARQFGRGDTINYLHGSEVAFWPDSKSTMAGLFQAVPRASGEICLESTGNGVGNFYYKSCMRSLSGDTNFKMHFFGWLDDPDCFVELSPARRDFFSNLIYNLRQSYENDTSEDKQKPEELILIDEYDAQLEHIAFRYDKLRDELDEDDVLFKQEYPTTIQDCFQSTGYSLFNKVELSSSISWKRHDLHSYILSGHPYKKDRYVLGADVAGGVGKDDSTIEVISLDKMSQVYEYCNNRIDPEQFAYKIDEVANMFSGAYVGVESNNHGLTTLATLRKLYPSNLIYSAPVSPRDIKDSGRPSLMELGVKTNRATKPLMVGDLRRLLRFIKIYSEKLHLQLKSFVEKDNGSMEAEEGAKDDLVMALAVLARIYNDAALYLRPVDSLSKRLKASDPFTLDNMLESIDNNRTSIYPISGRVDSDNIYDHIPIISGEY